MWRRTGMAFLAVCVVAGAAGAADRVQGNWQGEFTSGIQGTISAKIIAQGDNNYQAFVTADANGEEHKVELQGKGSENAGAFYGRTDADGTPLTVLAQAFNQEMKGQVLGLEMPVEFTMNRVELKPSTLGLAPPAGAVVIFDGNNLDKWTSVPDKWNLGNGAMTVAHPSLMTTEEYGSGTYHIEFRTPLMPNERGQGRGNSGVYMLGRYEVQVLDSFGLPPADNEAGGIYQMAVPLVNASLPPEEWQTYDITFTVAKFDASGKKIEPARLTVKHNDILIHDNVVLGGPTPGGVSDQDAPKGPLLLQNHGNSVSYRNIWYAPAAE